MAVPALSTMQTDVRLLIQDTSTTSPGLSDANITNLINRAYYWWYENMQKRTQVKDVVTTAVGSITYTSALTDPEFYGVFVWSGSEFVRDLERMEWNQLLWCVNKLDYSGVDITHYACRKLTGGAAAAENRWEFAFFPIPTSVSAIRAYARIYPGALSGATDTPAVGDFEAVCIEHIAAYWGGMLIDRADLSQAAIAFLPQMVQDKLTAERKRDDPLRRPEEAIL